MIGAAGNPKGKWRHSVDLGLKRLGEEPILLQQRLGQPGAGRNHYVKELQPWPESRYRGRRGRKEQRCLFLLPTALLHWPNATWSHGGRDTGDVTPCSRPPVQGPGQRKQRTDCVDRVHGPESNSCRCQHQCVSITHFTNQNRTRTKGAPSLKVQPFLQIMADLACNGIIFISSGIFAWYLTTCWKILPTLQPL